MSHVFACALPKENREGSMKNEWTKATRCSNGGCVWVRHHPDNTIQIRGGDGTSGPTIQFPPDVWAEFIHAVRTETIRP